MFYFYTLILPSIILGISYYVTPVKPRKFYEYVNMLVKTLPFLFAYGFLLYFLEMGGKIDSGWSFYSFMFFLVPIAVIIILFKVFYFIKNKKK